MPLRYFVGIDWASTKHDVCVLDPQGQMLSSLRDPPLGRGALGR